MRKKLLSVLFLVCGLVFWGTGGAISSALPPIDLGTVVVTPSGSEIPYSDVSASMSIVRKEEIDAYNAKNCTDILNNIPGLFINKTGDYGRADVDIRGIGDRGIKVMVLVDGRPVKMGIFGCTISHSLPLSSVEKIEVYKSPASVLYGSDALGGVVNIITKETEQDFKAEGGFSLGSFNSLKFNADIMGNAQGFNYLFSLNKTDSDGYVDNSSYDAYDILGKFGYKINDKYSMQFISKFFNGLKHEPSPAPEDSWNDYERGAVDAALKRKTKDLNLSLKAYRNFGWHRFSDGFDSSDYTNGVKADSVVRIKGKTKLYSGMEFRQQSGKINSPEPFSGEWKKNEYSVFIHHQNNMVYDDVIFVLGGRYNIDEVSGESFVSEAGLVWNAADNTSIKLNRSEGFRSPQINELYVYPPSNTELKPEKSVNYNIGVVQRIYNFGSVECSAFYTEGKNLIEKDFSSSPILFKNRGSFTFKGAEAGMNLRLLKNLNTGLSYSYLDPGVHTTGKPGNKIDFSAGYSFRKFDINLFGQHVSDYYMSDNSKDKINDYFVADAKIIYRIWNNLNIFTAVDNIFDRDYKVYADLPGGSAGLYQMPGRAFSVGVNAEF